MNFIRRPPVVILTTRDEILPATWMFDGSTPKGVMKLALRGDSRRPKTEEERYWLNPHPGQLA